MAVVYTLKLFQSIYYVVEFKLRGNHPRHIKSLLWSFSTKNKNRCKTSSLQLKNKQFANHF